MKVKDKRNDEVFSSFPNYGKHDIHGAPYGYLVVSNNFKVLYFYCNNPNEYAEVDYMDVTDIFEILDNNA